MENNKITGLQRQLVLEYLLNRDVQLNFFLPEDKKTDSTNVAPLFSLNSNQYKVHDKGLILLFNYPPLLNDYINKNLKIHFYYNKLALFFEANLQQSSSNPVIVIPDTIMRLQEVNKEKNPDFTLTVFSMAGAKAGLQKSNRIKIQCDFDENYPLFQNSDYMECVKRFLNQEKTIKTDPIEDRIHPPKVIYLTEKKIVFAAFKRDMPFSQGCDYPLLMSFPLTGPIKERNLQMSCLVDEVYENFDHDLLCACASLSSIKEEDLRFLTDKIKL